MPRIFVIGGPNGAGKTTAAVGSLPEILECEEYVNADAIAKALSPFASDRAAFKAGRLMLETIHELAAAKRDFAFETTMASRSFVPFLKRCRSEGYEVRLVFLWLHSARLAQSRVAKRVRSGGHVFPRRSSNGAIGLGSAISYIFTSRRQTNGPFTTILVAIPVSLLDRSHPERCSCSSQRSGTSSLPSQNETSCQI